MHFVKKYSINIIDQGLYLMQKTINTMEQKSLWQRQDIHAKGFQELVTDAELPKIYQNALPGLLLKLELNTQFSRMSREKLLKVVQKDCGIMDMERSLCVLMLLRLGLDIKEIAGSALATPTTVVNFKCISMQKWSSCRAYKTILGDGKIMPEFYEFLMGYPVGYTDLNHSGMQ